MFIHINSLFSDNSSYFSLIISFCTDKKILTKSFPKYSNNFLAPTLSVKKMSTISTNINMFAGKVLVSEEEAMNERIR